MEKPFRIIKAGLLFSLQLFVLVTHAQQKELFKNADDYGFMWWEDAIFKTRDYTFHIKTNHYALSFNCENLELKGLGIVKNDPGETTVLRESQAQSVSGTQPATFEAAFEADGNRYAATGTPLIADGKRSYDYYQLVESGKYFHRRFLKNVTYEPGAPARQTDHSGIEIASWPDRLLFMQRIRPMQEITRGVLDLSLDLDDKYSLLLQEGPACALVAADGTGYVFVATSAGTLEVDAATAKVTVQTRARTPWINPSASGLYTFP